MIYKDMKYLVVIIALILVFSLFANVYAIDKNSNYYKYCIKLTDKRIRSIECPDVFPKGESSFVPGG